MSIHRKSNSDAGQSLISPLFPITYNPLKNKRIAVGKRRMTPLFRFILAGSEVNSPFIHGDGSIEKKPSRHLQSDKIPTPKI